MRASTTRHVRSVAAALAAALVACSGGAPDPAAAFARASQAPPRAAPSAGEPARAPAPTPPAAASPASAGAVGRRYAGGRPIAWWSERLARLRRDGPDDVYRLTLERARLNGLEVVEREGGEVSVAFAGASVAPGARP